MIAVTATKLDQGSDMVLQNSVYINDGNRDGIDMIFAIELGLTGVMKNTFVGHRLGQATNYSAVAVTLPKGTFVAGRAILVSPLYLSSQVVRGA